MTKSNSKAKLRLVHGPKKKVIGKPVKLKKKEEDQAETLELLATVDFWKQEIASLKSENFKSVDEATEALIGKVLVRLNLHEADLKDVNEFLRLVFESSEGLQSALRNALRLRD